jgi:hypothetical protein
VLIVALLAHLAYLLTRRSTGLRTL